MSCFLRSNGPTTLYLVTDLAIYNSTSALVVLEEMFRETLQTLACLSVLTSTYSLHMSTRDSYRNPLVDHHHMNLAQFNDPPHSTGQQELQQQQQLKLASLQLQQQSQQSKHTAAAAMAAASSSSSNLNNKQQQQQRQQDDDDLLLDDNEIPDYNGVLIQPPPPPIGPILQPRGLQELFGTATKYDIRMQQQQHEPAAASASYLPVANKRAPNTSGGGSGGAIMFPTMSHGIASQLMLRKPRGSRQYDVPQIGKYCTWLDLI